MCDKCKDNQCLIGEKCGEMDNSGMLIEDATMSAFNQPTFDSKVKTNFNKKNK